MLWASSLGLPDFTSPCRSVHQGGYVSVRECACGEIRETGGWVFKEKDAQRSRERRDTDREREK